MPDFESFPPSMFDRADGIDHGAGVVGTATPAGAVKAVTASGDATWFEELPNSPEIERAEQGTIRHTFKCDWQSAMDNIAAVGRGLFLVDSFGNESRVLSAKITHGRGADEDGDGSDCTFEVIAESISFDTPIDDFDADDVEENIDIVWHPRYSSVRQYNLNSSGGIINGALWTGYQIVKFVRDAAALGNTITQNDNIANLNSTKIADSTVLALAIELVNKMRRGETEFYFSGLRVTWTQYFYLPPLMDSGGYIQDPVTQGGLPAYFWSDTGEVGGNNTLEYLTLLTNPDIYGDGFSWLRKADKRGFQRIWHRLTRTWIGAPLGHWDSDLYPQSI